MLPLLRETAGRKGIVDNPSKEMDQKRSSSFVNHVGSMPGEYSFAGDDTLHGYETR